MNRNIPKLNLTLALLGVGILFLLLLVNFLTFELPKTGYNHNEIRLIISYIYVYGSILMMFLIFGLSAVSIIISAICIFKRTHNYKSIIALVISSIMLIMCGVNMILQFVYEQDLLGMIF
ncbi:ABC-type Na+ efflux pump permease subunit [Dysgonomonas hofstadii]|uniref:ABC-type Na+ efflux pump permease subunit n=1 Tax=Dysgonomonas hofstadii TaxID=637886 RepID=A0A840CES2_9BACT|nr:hypothetical protein [Dysgonomonas hofstadii]MBB4034487.1 ABC-type Na+ efflux pump permease subunit [Dysgonomonas hofstadii]